MNGPGPLAYGGLALLAVVWGSSFALTVVALEGFAPMAVSGLRIWLSLCAVLVILRLTGRHLPRDLRSWGWCAGLGVLGLLLPFSLLSWGQQQVPSSIAAILISGAPLFVLLLSRIVLQERISPRKWVGFAIGFVGLVVLIGPSALSGISEVSGIGQIACLGAALSYASSSLLIRRMPPIPPLEATAAAQTCAALFAIPLCLAPTLSATPGPSALVAVTVLGVVQTGMAHLLRYVLVKQAGPVFVSTVGYMIPVWAGFLGIAFFGEPATLQTGTAFALILTGLLIARDRVRPRATPARTG